MAVEGTGPHLTEREFLTRLETTSGIVPVGIDVETNRLMWMNLERFHCYEGSFRRSLSLFTALMQRLGRTPERFTTNMEVLDSADLTKNCLYPSGFIFHAGRCGSTLLCKVLATSRAHCILSEPTPSNLIWTVLTEGFRKPVCWTPKNRRRYKNLTLAQGRKRLAGYNRYFIKFTSHNVLFFEYIHSIFPDVPAVFLYRNPAAVLASYLAGLPGWWRSPGIKALAAACTEEDLSGASHLMIAEKVLIHYFSAALQAGHLGLRYLDYEDLTPAELPRILDVFNVQWSPQTLDVANHAFRFDSKVDFRADLFDPELRNSKKRHVAESIAVDALLQSLYGLLRNNRS